MCACKNGLTPLHMEIMIHAHSYADPYRAKAQVPYDYMLELSQLGLITLEHVGVNIRDLSFKLRSTEKGQAWLEEALATPMPVEKTIWTFDHA